MHFLKTGRMGLLAAIAAVVAVVGLLPLFGSTAYAAGVNLNNSVAMSQFIIPGTAVTRTTAVLNNTDQAPLTLNVSSTTGFAASGQLLVSDGAWGDGGKNGAEILTYDSKTATSFHITERGPDKIASSAKKNHPSNSKVKQATVTTGALAAATGPQSTLMTNITNTQGGCGSPTTCPVGNLTTPFLITLASTAGFPASGEITISQQDVQTSNQGGVQFSGGTTATEMFGYDNSACSTGANQLCITQRAQQSTNTAYAHKATAFAQPGGTSGVSKVSLNFMLDVKNNTGTGSGFFPAGSLMVCDATNPLTNCELMGHNNAGTKLAAPGATQFRINDRGAATGTFDKTAIVAHGAGSIVTGADGFLTCINGAKQPGVDTDLVTPGVQEPVGQTAGTSVGLTATCYTTTQPGAGGDAIPTCCPPAGGDIVGQDLIVMNSIAGQPFLSTGGFTHVVLGAVPAVDTNGPSDGTLNLISPCILDFTPGTNLQVNVTLTADKTVENTDTGTITVVLDTIHDNNSGGSAADDCDDPAGTDNFTSTTYDSPSSAVEDADDDTDRDGCLDQRELESQKALGGTRDPWNPYDYYDINGDGAVSVGVDILQVAAAFGAGNPNYAPRKDRGPLNYGPFGWNKSGPNASVGVDDILAVASQFGDACPHNGALYTGSDNYWYN